MPERDEAKRPDETAARPPARGAGGGGPTSAPDAATIAAAPDDADDLVGYHFKRLMGSRKSWVLTVVGALIIGGVLGVATGPAFGVIGFLGVALGRVAVTWFIADRRAADSFFTYYASQHGFELGGKHKLPESTPLLKQGDDRYAERTLSGKLAPDCEGILALFTYEEEHTDSRGNRDTDYYRYTVGLVPVPQCAPFVPELFCQPRFGFRALEGFEDVFRRSKERVELESDALQDKYEIFAGKGQDANRLRQLFEPSFIVWLTDSAPEDFAFELVDGNLCCYVTGHKQDNAGLDSVSAATATVARRLREESAE